MVLLSLYYLFYLKKMKNTALHYGAVLYDFSVSLSDNTLEITLKVINELAVQFFRTSFTNESLPTKLKQKVDHIEKLFRFLNDKGNFMIDVFRGEVILLLNKMELDEFVYEKIGIKLEMCELVKD